MKAMVYHEYSSPDNLELQEIEMPAVDMNGVLVKDHAASVKWLDWHFLTGTPAMVRLMAGLLKPKNHVLGIDLAGRVDVVGAKVTQFSAGDEIFGSTTHGCFAEYVSVSQDDVLLKPTNITFVEAAAVGAAASTALHGLRDMGRIASGQMVLINGASGGVGTFAVQIARFFGAEVTGVCSTRNVELVRSIGADHVIDYTMDDFTRIGQHYDLIFDVVAKRSYSDCKHVLCPHGIYVTTEFSPGLMLQGKWISLTESQNMVPLQPKPPNKQDQAFIKQLLEDGEIIPVIDRCYPLIEAPAALRYLGKGHAQGKVVITM